VDARNKPGHDELAAQMSHSLCDLVLATTSDGDPRACFLKNFGHGGVADAVAIGMREVFPVTRDLFFTGQGVPGV
jgi:hypothetical protein